MDHIDSIKENVVIYKELIRHKHTVIRDYDKRQAEFQAEIEILQGAKNEHSVEYWTAAEDIVKYEKLLQEAEEEIAKSKDNRVEILKKTVRAIRLKKQIAELELQLAAC